MYQYSLLNQDQATLFERFTYPTYRHLLRILDFNPSIIPVGISLNSQPIGLGLAKIYQHQIAEILSLVIHSQHQKQGLGTNLLIYLEQVIKNNQCKLLAIQYRESPTTAYFERILIKQNWEPPTISKIVYEGNINSLKSSNLLKGPKRFKGYTVFSWFSLKDGLTDKERHFIKTQGIAHPEILSPFTEEEIIEPLNSLGLRSSHGEIVGWIITHRLNDNIIRYTKLFLREDIRGGRGILLLIKSLQLQLEYSLKYNKGEKACFVVEADNTEMLTFVRNKLAIYLEQSNSYRSHKNI